MEELQVPISDSAFYLSYFYDVVRAPSLADGIGRLLHDNRSEAPDIVNALHKFNVMPELVVAAAHRLLQVAESPFAFYIHSVLSLTGLGVAAAALTASILGRSPVCGVLAVSLYFALCFSPSMAVGTRIHTASMLALREHWGIPTLLVHNALLVAVLDGYARRRPLALLMGYVLTTCLFEASWQFAPFVLLLQMLSLLGAHVLRCLPRRHMGEIALAAVLGTFLALVLH